MNTVKVNPFQNVSPLQSAHVGSDGKTLTGASISSAGGCPLLLSLAGTMAAALIQRNEAIDSEACATKSLEFAIALINRFNDIKPIEAEGVANEETEAKQSSTEGD